MKSTLGSLTKGLCISLFAVPVFAETSIVELEARILTSSVAISDQHLVT